jgi:hypothetical protein
MLGSAELAAPQAVAEHNHRMATGSDFVRGQKRATALGANAEDLEVVPRDELAPDLAGAPASAKVGGSQAGAKESGECAIVIAKVLVVGIRDAELASGARLAEDDGEPGRAVNACGGLKRSPSAS